MRCFLGPSYQSYEHPLQNDSRILGLVQMPCFGTGAKAQTRTKTQYSVHLAMRCFLGPSCQSYENLLQNDSRILGPAQTRRFEIRAKAPPCINKQYLLR